MLTIPNDVEIKLSYFCHVTFPAQHAAKDDDSIIPTS